MNTADQYCILLELKLKTVETAIKEANKWLLAMEGISILHSMEETNEYYSVIRDIIGEDN